MRTHGAINFEWILVVFSAIMSQKKGGPSGHAPASKGGLTSLSLPTANTARQHLDSSKKSRNKQIHPGYSMFEWNKICSSGVDMAGTKGQLLKVTPEELARHCTDGDLWTAVRGVVYNVTQFAAYHPGGRAQLMRGAGQDCTELFDKIHVWVSSEAILQKCIVGYLVGVSPPKKPSTLNVSVSKPPFPGESSDKNSPGTDVLSFQVPSIGGVDISDVGGNMEGGNMEDSRRNEADEELEVTISMSGISIQDTNISIPVPVISIPVISNSALHSGDITKPSQSDNQRPFPTKTPVTKHYLPPYITDHPLISKTAYETAV